MVSYIYIYSIYTHISSQLRHFSYHFLHFPRAIFDPCTWLRCQPFLQRLQRLPCGQRAAAAPNGLDPQTWKLL